MKRKFIGNHLRVGKQGQITLPSSICRQANLVEGTVLKVSVDADGSIRLVPIPAKVQALMEQAQLNDVDWALNQKEKF
jgi:AbrB family looped-hinge helix DNA binding protein